MSDEVLVGVDGSTDAEVGMRWAVRFAALTGRRLVLAYAWQQGRRLEGVFATPHADAPDVAGDVVARLRDWAHGKLGGTEASYVALQGAGAPSLVGEASRLRAALIVVGASGSGGARRALLGSVSRQLTSCPSHAVAVVPTEVREREDGPPRLVVGVDGSDGSSRALRWAADAARQAGGEVVAVHAFECPISDVSSEEAASLAQERQWRVEEEWCAPLRADAVPYRIVVERGDPRAALRRVAEAERPLCLVVGSRGLGVMSQTLLGSVTHRLVRESPCTTVIIPSARDRAIWPPRVD